MFQNLKLIVGSNSKKNPMLLGERTYSDNHMNQGEAETSNGAIQSSELRASKAVKSNGSALKGAMSAEKKSSPSKGGSESTSH